MRNKFRFIVRDKETRKILGAFETRNMAELFAGSLDGIEIDAMPIFEEVGELELRTDSLFLDETRLHIVIADALGIRLESKTDTHSFGNVLITIRPAQTPDD